MMVKVEDRVHVLRGLVKSSPAGVASVVELSAMQLKKALHNPTDYFLGVLKFAEDGGVDLCAPGAESAPKADDPEEDAPAAPPVALDEDAR